LSIDKEQEEEEDDRMTIKGVSRLSRGWGKETTRRTERRQGSIQELLLLLLVDVGVRRR
jgi:hypothetical protein